MTSCHPIRSVIILVIKQIGLPLPGRPILLITRMITDRIGLHSVLLPLLIDKCHSSYLRRKFNLEQEGTVTLDCLLMNTDK